MRHAILASVLGVKVDPPTREQIERLVKEELRLLAQQTIADSDQLRIEEIHAALDRCCAVLHRRRAAQERWQSPGQLWIQPEVIVTETP